MDDDGDADQAPLVDLFEREVEQIFAYLLSRCGSRAVAEDLTSETFAAACRHHERGRAHEVTGAWLQTVAHRRLVDHWRRESARRRAVDRLVSFGERAGDPALVAGRDDRVDRALASLPVRQRAALVLKYMDDFSTTEVADALDLSYKAAESLLSRARRNFERSYGGDR